MRRLRRKGRGGRWEALRRGIDPWPAQEPRHDRHVQNPIDVVRRRAAADALSDLDVAPENLRASEPANAEIPEPAETIKTAGLLYPLLMRSRPQGRASLHGAGRATAASGAAKPCRGAAHRPCFGVKMEVARDKALQAAAIGVSNTQRAPVHVADVIVAIGKLKSLKMTPTKIATGVGARRDRGEAAAMPG